MLCYYRYSANTLTVHRLLCESHHQSNLGRVLTVYSIMHEYLGYVSSSCSSREWISSVVLCSLSCACLQAGVAPPCSLKQLYLPLCRVMADVSAQPSLLPAPGVRFPQAQGRLVWAKEFGRLGRWESEQEHQAGRTVQVCPRWLNSFFFQWILEWTPGQTEAHGY